MNKICKHCHKDHTIANTGPLTVCERKAYFMLGGAQGKSASGEKIRGFGLGQKRFQLTDHE